MTDQPAVAVAGAASAPPARLEPDAIGVAQDTVIGMASSAPAVSVGLTLAALTAATAYGGGPVIILTAIPMLIIANAYRRLNMWNANCGASFEWVGRSISPSLGFITGWLMIAGYLTGAVSGVEVLGPSVVAVFSKNGSAGGTWTDIAIATGVTIAMMIIAVVGIRLTARTQVGMAILEYGLLIGFAIAGLYEVLHHHAGTLHFSSSWLSLSGVGGHGSAVSGLLIAVFIFSGWEGTLYVNEEVKHRRINPGRAAIWAVVLLTGIYVLATIGLQGAVSPAKLQAHSTSALVYVALQIGGPNWAKAMALSLALSVIALTLTSVVLTARIIYGMASYRTLPEFLATVSRRFATPVAASILVGVLIVALTWIYLLATSVQNAFDDVVDVSGLLFAAFYILTALATMVYYRRRVFTSLWDAVVLGILPLAAAAFLGWIIVKSMIGAPAAQIWSLGGILAFGIVLMFVARFGLKSPFFSIPRESDGAPE
ncbi:MAG TPA: APC family permease [Streptosporangiaceae bacterium]|jgi:amino acid transporter